ncbi:diaminopimelate epimerase [Halorhodospira halochloris]|uniref:diaminopimelate epimerase n=1 Tax=Halorhodospira halochloris TaxID=1052 RepID=UPI001EE8455F|nr:diaminopimelate epimerase [Halorhodospira halochloris]
MSMRFTKMEALGNDFVVLNAMQQPLKLSAEQIKLLSDRRRGVGCDQVLLAEAARDVGADVRYRIFNADGSEVEHCGNGVRCLARFLVNEGIVSGPRIYVETGLGINVVEIARDGNVTVDMGAPLLKPEKIPFRASAQEVTYNLETTSGSVDISAVSMGNPHAVLVVDDIATAPVHELGTVIGAHPRFPNRTNVGFMQVKSRDSVMLRVYERGVGETPACGTGACAAVVAGRLRGLLDSTVNVELPGGQLEIGWRADSEPVMMTGPARAVFHGEINI